MQPPPVAKDGEGTDEDSAGKGSAQTTEQVTTETGDVPSLGINFRGADCGTDPITLDVGLAFALYLEEIAMLAEQRTYLGAAGEDGTETAGSQSEAASDTDDLAGSSKAGEAATTEPATTEGHGNGARSEPV